MQATAIQGYARQLLEEHGAKAIAEVAQRAIACEKAGDKEHAQICRRVEAALMLMRGPRQTREAADDFLACEHDRHLIGRTSIVSVAVRSASVRQVQTLPRPPLSTLPDTTFLGVDTAA
jgi:hypothetical protein